MECPECGKEMGDPIDTTYSNKEPTTGQYTGNIFYCDACELHWLEDLLHSSGVHVWYY